MKHPEEIFPKQKGKRSVADHGSSMTVGIELLVSDIY